MKSFPKPNIFISFVIITLYTSILKVSHAFAPLCTIHNIKRLPNKISQSPISSLPSLHYHRKTATSAVTFFRNTKTRISMGIFDRISTFFENRSQDFVPIETMDDNYGPPVILLFGIPKGIDNNEIRDMISDGAPIASKTDFGIRVKRVIEENDTIASISNTINESTSSANVCSSNWLDCTMKEILQGVMDEEISLNGSDSSAASTTGLNIYISSTILDGKQNRWKLSCPVIYCSGLSNQEMMATYNILAKEIFDETGGISYAACAKAVPPAMEKAFRNVIMDITGDHMDALGGEGSEQNSNE